MSEELDSSPASDEAPAPEDAPAADTEEAPASPEEVLADAQEDVLDFLEGLLDTMELDGDVNAEVVDESINAEITGPDAGLLIGRRGQTLDAIQELLRTAVQSQAQARVRVSLDIEGYRERRAADLGREVRDLAERVLAEGGEMALEPMSAYERKIVHDTVGTIEGVTSFSEGQEPRRWVVLRADQET